jgi:hypothetical protein
MFAECLEQASESAMGTGDGGASHSMALLHLGDNGTTQAEPKELLRNVTCIKELLL